jgi:hypothetical protein
MIGYAQRLSWLIFNYSEMSVENSAGKFGSFLRIISFSFHR